jgi:hypothetical protein
VDITHSLKKITTGALVSGAVAVASLGLATGTAHAGAYHWCPGDPPPQAVVPRPSGGFWLGPVDPDWDTTVCHDYVARDGQVAEGIPCSLPQFQWFQCPPGTTPNPLMPLIPNK